MTRLARGSGALDQFLPQPAGRQHPARCFCPAAPRSCRTRTAFFRKNSRVPIEYFNPFRNIEIDPSVRKEELAKCAHFFGEVVGLGLRNSPSAHWRSTCCRDPSGFGRRQWSRNAPISRARPFAVAGAPLLVGIYRGSVIQRQQFNLLDQETTNLANIDRQIKKTSRLTSRISRTKPTKSRS